MAEHIKLKAGGYVRTGWQSMQVFLSIDQIADQFSLVMNNQPDVNAVPVAGDLESQNLLVCNQLCQISIGETVVLTGYVDDYKPSYTETSAKVQLSGRSRTADLVDSSGFGASDSKKFNKVKLDIIARGFAEFLGLKFVVEDGVDVGDPVTATLESGETIGEFLEKQARYRGLIFTSGKFGELVLKKPGVEMTTVDIQRGVNVLAATASYSAKDVFTNYVVVSQLNDEDSLLSAAVANRQRGEYIDPLLGNRFRPKVILSEKNIKQTDCKALAEWHGRLANARGRSVTYTLHGWRENPADLSSPIWLPGKMVSISDDFMKISGERLIVSVALEQTNDQQLAHLTVAPLAGYDYKDTPPDTDDDNVQQEILEIAAGRA